MTVLLQEAIAEFQAEAFVRRKVHFPKMFRDVGMAVPKTTEKLGVETGHTNTAQITPSLRTSFFHAHAMLFQVILIT